MTLEEYYKTCHNILKQVRESEEWKSWAVTIKDLYIIVDALYDKLIIEQAISHTLKNQHEVKENRRRIDRITRTTAKMLLILKDAIENEKE